jgi:hypothetical protein
LEFRSIQTTIPELERELVAAEASLVEVDKLNEDKEYWGHGAEKRVGRAAAMIQWLELAEKHHFNAALGTGSCFGYVLVADRFVVSLVGNSWRTLDRNKWYRYKSPEQFIERYVNGR